MLVLVDVDVVSIVLCLCLCRSVRAAVVGKTPAYNNVGEQLQIVVQYVDQALVNTTRFFVYRQNPIVRDIFPLTHLLTYVYLTL